MTKIARYTIPPTPEALTEHIGEEIGISPWLAVSQDTIDTFADATGDHQWVHVDPVRAATSPFGTPIAHGYLILSLASGLLLDMFGFGESVTVLNYGLDKVRFPASVPSGSPVRLRAELLEAEPKGAGTQIKVRATFEAKGVERPVCVAEILWRVIPQ